MTKRKELHKDKDNLHNILRILGWRKDNIIESSSQKEFDECVKYINKTIGNIDKKIAKSPIGRRYSGTFYVKKPYAIPYETIKINGSAFMREDLVSWSIESDQDEAKHLSYLKVIYKDKNMRDKIDVSEAVDVFE